VASLCPNCKQNSITLRENNTVLTTNQATLFPNTAELRRRSLDFADPQDKLDSVIHSFKPTFLTSPPVTEENKDITYDEKDKQAKEIKEKEKPVSPPKEKEKEPEKEKPKEKPAATKDAPKDGAKGGSKKNKKKKGK